MCDRLRQNLTNEEFVSPALGYELMMKMSRNSLTRKNHLEFLDENFYAIQSRFDGIVAIAKSLETAALFWNTNERLEKVFQTIQIQTFNTKHCIIKF